MLLSLLSWHFWYILTAYPLCKVFLIGCWNKDYYYAWVVNVLLAEIRMIIVHQFIIAIYVMFYHMHGLVSLAIDMSFMPYGCCVMLSVSSLHSMNSSPFVFWSLLLSSCGISVVLSSHLCLCFLKYQLLIILLFLLLSFLLSLFWICNYVRIFSFIWNKAFTIVIVFLTCETKQTQVSFSNKPSSTFIMVKYTMSIWSNYCGCFYCHSPVVSP